MSKLVEKKIKKTKIPKEDDIISSKVEDPFDLSNMDGVGDVRKKRMQAAGINDIMGLIISNPQEVAEVTGLTPEESFKMIEKARLILVERGIIRSSFMTGTEYFKHRRDDIKYIKLGAPGVDTILGGGIETQALTEIYGEFGSGKTQWCHTAAVMATRPEEEGGLNGNVIWINSEETFRPNRVKEIAEERGFIPKFNEDDFNDKESEEYKEAKKEHEKELFKLLDRIAVVKPENADHQVYLIDHIGEFIDKDKKEKKDGDPTPKLIIVDSITALFRAEYIGRAHLADRQQHLGPHMAKLKRIAEKYDLAVLVTNQVMAKAGMSFGDPTTPVGGHTVGHASTYRLYLRKSGKNRVAKMEDSPAHPQGEALYTLTKAGVIDADE